MYYLNKCVKSWLVLNFLLWGAFGSDEPCVCVFNLVMGFRIVFIQASACYRLIDNVSNRLGMDSILTKL